ncbi:putative mitochondrial protein [Tanacetum coccineum]
MAPTTRITTTSNNDDGVNERLRFVEEALANITQTMQEMVIMYQGMNGNGRNQNQHQFTRMTKVDFPKFSRDDVKGQFIMLNGENVSWNVYTNRILQRFGTMYDDPDSEIRKIKYQSNAKEYQDTFDILLSRVDISEDHAVSFYLGRLPTEIEMGVRMFRPKTLVNAYQLTNLQEATLEVVKKNKAVMSSQSGRFGGGSNNYGSNAKSSLLPLPASNSNWRNKPNTPTNAPCSGQLFSIVVLLGDEMECEEECMEEESPLPDEVPQISLNALNCANSFQTMRITRKIGKHEVHILVDCGSTHNFLDVNIAKQVGCKVKSTCPLVVTVGGGR